MEDKKTGPREYMALPIAGSVVVNPVKYLSKPDGWVMETADFTELSYFLGYKFEPRSLYSIWSPEGVIRGGHLESRSKLVTVLTGSLYYMFVDVRPGSDRGKTHSFYLGDCPESIGQSVLIPEGVVDTYIPVYGGNLTHQVADGPYNKLANERTLNIFDSDLDFKIPTKGVHHVVVNEEKRLLSYKEFIAGLK